MAYAWRSERSFAGALELVALPVPPASVVGSELMTGAS